MPHRAKPTPIEQTLTEKHRLAVVGSLTAKVVHALNNPLTLLKVNLSWLGERMSEGEVSGELAEGSADFMVEVREGLAVVEAHVVALREFVQGDTPAAEYDLVEASELAIAVADVKVRYGAHIRLVSERPVRLVGRKRQIQQLLVSLLLHADSRPTSLGDIDVTVAQTADGGATLAVFDERPPGIQPNVPEGSSEDEFDPEIGLMIASFIAADHGGRLEVIDREDRGPCYQVTLPADSARPES